MNKSETRYKNQLEKDIIMDLIGLIQFGIELKIPNFIDKSFMVIYEYTKFMEQYNVKYVENSVVMTRKDIGSKLGKIMDRWIIDKNLAINLMGSLSVGGDLNLQIDCWQKFLYELKLYLIANDESDQVYRNAHYEVHSKEYPLLKNYTEKLDTELPEVSVVINTMLEVEKEELYKQLESVNKLIKKNQSG